jgi:hypothetical protein
MAKHCKSIRKRQIPDQLYLADEYNDDFTDPNHQENSSHEENIEQEEMTYSLLTLEEVEVDEVVPAIPAGSAQPPGLNTPLTRQSFRKLLSIYCFLF